MAIITPLKKIFKWQQASEKIPYKVYTALLTQTGTDAPIATVLENTIGNIVWTRSSAGDYQATLNEAFTLGKTYLNCWLNYASCNASFSNAATTATSNELYFFTYDDNPSLGLTSLVDLGGDGLYVEIRVYN